MDEAPLRMSICTTSGRSFLIVEGPLIGASRSSSSVGAFGDHNPGWAKLSMPASVLIHKEESCFSLSNAPYKSFTTIRSSSNSTDYVRYLHDSDFRDH